MVEKTPGSFEQELPNRAVSLSELQSQFVLMSGEPGGYQQPHRITKNLIKNLSGTRFYVSLSVSSSSGEKEFGGYLTEEFVDLVLVTPTLYKLEQKLREQKISFRGLGQPGYQVFQQALKSVRPK